MDQATAQVPSFSIIIPTYNRSETVERTIRQLADVDYPDDRYEVIIVDNSSDDTPKMVERMAAQSGCAVRLLHNSERLPAVKRNQGLAMSNADYVIFLNDDLWVEPQFLREHAATHAKFAPEPVAVLGRCQQSAEMPRTPFIEFYEPFAYHELVDREDEPLRWWYFWTMNVSMPRREMIERNLVLHEDWREIGLEDVELGWRWIQAGNKLVYNPRAAGHHYHPHTLDSASRLQASIGRGLRDLEWLAPDPQLLERFGVWTPRNGPRALVRGLIRRTLFNSRTVPHVQRWLNQQRKNSPVTRWLYWKVLLHHTEHGYYSTAPRRPPRTAIRPRQTAKSATPACAQSAVSES